MNQLSGYCEVTLNGKLRAFKFGTNATALFCEMNKLSLLAAMQRLSNVGLMDLRDMFYSAYKTNCLLKGIEDEAGGALQFGEWLDEVEQDDYEKLLMTLQSANTFGGVGSGMKEEKKNNTNGPT